jgi:hypothetical protein
LFSLKIRKSFAASRQKEKEAKKIIAAKPRTAAKRQEQEGGDFAASPQG